MKALSKKVNTRIAAMLLSVSSAVMSASALSAPDNLINTIMWSTDEIDVISTWECTSATTMKERHTFSVDINHKRGDPTHRRIDVSTAFEGESIIPKNTDPYSMSVLTKTLHLGDEDRTPMRSGRTIEFERPYGKVVGVSFRDVTMDPETRKVTLGDWKMASDWRKHRDQLLENFDCGFHVW